MIFLKENSPFPDISLANEEGLLAIGGKLTSQRLLDAYSLGIFPWFTEGQPILWWSPDPRMVLFLDQFKPSKSLKKTMASNLFQITYNTAFAKVIQECALAKRKGQTGTWINREMINAYLNLHQEGYAISIEVWQNEKLVGGLYGIDLAEKRIFCGESMFHKTNNASKVAFMHLIQKLKEKNYLLIDCQVYTKHLESLGAKEISRNHFVEFLTK